jgi:replicative DNA helicase
MEIIKLEKGYLTILTGKSDMGKSTITVYECGENLRAGQKVVFFSYEYCQSIIYNKLISHFNLSWSQLLNLNIVDAAGLHLDDLVSFMRAKKGNVDALYVDYLDLLKAATFSKAKNETEDLQQIQKIVKTLAALAKELDISVVLLSQVGSSSDFEKAVERLNLFTEKADKNTIKMFIGKGNIIDARIDYADIVHVIHVDGYNLKHFSSINIKEIYGDN